MMEKEHYKKVVFKRCTAEHFKCQRLKGIHDKNSTQVPGAILAKSYHLTKGLRHLHSIVSKLSDTTKSLTQI